MLLLATLYIHKLNQHIFKTFDEAIILFINKDCHLIARLLQVLLTKLTFLLAYMPNLNLISSLKSRFL